MNTLAGARALRLVYTVLGAGISLSACATTDANGLRPAAPFGTPATLAKPDPVDATPTPEPALARRTNGRRPVPPQEFLTGSARRARLEQIVRRSRVVDACWTAALRREPSHTAERVSVRLEVGEEGRAVAAVGGASDARLAECVRLRFGSQNFGTGEPMVFEAVFGLLQGT